jgi:hypothetical protein
MCFRLFCASNAWLSRFSKRHRFSSQKCRTPKRPPSQSYTAKKYEFDFLNNINQIKVEYESRLILNCDETHKKTMNTPRCVWGKKGIIITRVYITFLFCMYIK